MAWCPQCDSEYIESFTRCKKCDVELIEKEEGENVFDYIFEDSVFLVHANNEVEADLLEPLLNSVGIQVTRNHREAGAYLSIYMGMSIFGVDLFVPKNQLNKAKEILENRALPLEMDKELEEEWQKEKVRVRKKRRNLILALLLIFHAPVVPWLFYNIFYYINMF